MHDRLECVNIIQYVCCDRAPNDLSTRQWSYATDELCKSCLNAEKEGEITTNFVLFAHDNIYFIHICPAGGRR